jgi:hypothetical protein
MEVTNTSDKATAREIQRHLFIENLHKQMDAAQSKVSSSQARVVRLASGYMDDGCSPEEIVELLYIDGVSSDIARECIASLSAGTSSDKESDCEWDFLFEDANGRIYRGSSIGMTVTAASKEEAMKKAADLVAPNQDSLEAVIDAEPIIP